MKAVVQVFTLDVLARVVLGATVVLLIRFMAPDQYAAYTLAFSAATMLGQMMSGGFNRTFIVGYDRLGLDRAPSAFLMLQIGLLAGLGGVMYLFAPHLHGLYGVALLLVVAQCLIEYVRTSFQQGMRFFRFSSVEILRAAILLGGVGLLIVTGTSISAYDALVVHTVALLLVFMVVFARRLEWRELRQVGLALRWMAAIVTGPYRYLFGYTILVAVMTQADFFLLRWLAGPEAVATYGSAFRYYTVLSMALGAVHTVFLPLIRSMQTEHELRSLLARHRRLVLAFIPVVLGGAVAARWVIPMIDLGKYPEAVSVFQILAISSVVSLAFAPHVNILLRFEDFPFLFGLTGVSLLVDVICNLIFVPHFGASGSALSSLTAFAIANTAVYLRSRSRLRSNAGEFAFASALPGVPNLG